MNMGMLPYHMFVAFVGLLHALCELHLEVACIYGEDLL